MIPKVLEYIEGIIPYQPGKPIEELERELGITGSIKLASNENPVGPSPAVIEAIIQNAAKISRYPDGDCFYLKQALAAELGVSRDEILIGNGSNEVIELALRSFVAPGDETVSARGAFLVYELSTRVIGGKAVMVPMKEHTHDPAAMLAAVTPRTRIVFFSNPNNPTGTAVGAKAVDAFLAELPPGILVVFDEAYREYVHRRDFPDSLALAKKHDNVVVMRTFSKAYGLAGLRIGYAVASKKIIEVMNKVRQPFNVNLLAQTAAIAALRDREHLAGVVALNRRELTRLEKALKALGLPYVPSETNFILLKVPRDGRGVYEDLLRKGVIVRTMHAYGYPDYIRVTVGLPEENDRFVRELAAVLGLAPPREV
jgi:histidinol-phosphate aminotransferase